MEEHVWIKCRKSDLAVVQAAVPGAIAQYKEVMKREVKKYKHVDIILEI